MGTQDFSIFQPFSKAPNQNLPPTSHVAQQPVPLQLENTLQEDQPSQSPQPTPEDLAKLGIKVRDFGYESTLPPIPAYVRRRQPPSKQIQPSVNPNKRPAPGFDIASLPTNHLGRERYAKKPRLETAIEDRDLEAGQAWPVDSQESEFSQEQNGWSQSTPSQSQAPYSDPVSQESTWIVTPVVTPNGSLQWPVQNTSDLPTSQLESRLHDMDESDHISYSQLGFSNPEDDFSQSATVPSPLYHPLVAKQATMTPPRATSPLRQPIPHQMSPLSPLSSLSSLSEPSSLPVATSAPILRYNLRSRPQPPSAPESPTKSSSHNRSRNARPVPRSKPSSRKEKP